MRCGLSEGRPFRTKSATLARLVLKEITDCLERGETVKLSSFGSGIGRNPKIGKEVPIPAAAGNATQAFRHPQAADQLPIPSGDLLLQTKCQGRALTIAARHGFHIAILVTALETTRHFCEIMLLASSRVRVRRYVVMPRRQLDQSQYSSGHPCQTSYMRPDRQASSITR